MTPRYLSYINGDFPAVEQYEIPAFIADSAVVEADGSKFVNAPQDETVYALFIGTNDLGVGAFLTDSQVNGTTLVNYTDCVFDSLERLYDQGARYFTLLNVVPLNLAPLYALPEDGGVGDNQYWMQKPADLTSISKRMQEEVVTVNAIYKYQLPYELYGLRKFSGAHFALFDVHSLVGPRRHERMRSRRVDPDMLTNLISVHRHLLQPNSIPEWLSTSQCDRFHPSLRHYDRTMRHFAQSG